MKKYKTSSSPELEPEVTPEKGKPPPAGSDTMPFVPEPTSSSSAKRSSKAYQVLEVFSRDHKEQVWNLHSQKAAFSKEHDQLKARA